MKWLLSLIVLFILTTPVSAQEFNAGIVQGLWYSQETVFAGQTVRIYVAVRNNTGSDLKGTVEFFDGEKRIDQESVSALDGRIIERWADWTPTYGEHTISATLSSTKLYTVGERTETIRVTSALAEDTFFVDYDTDNDGVGNKADIDDDGDGMSDAVEEVNGTDPLVFDEPTPEPVSDDTADSPNTSTSSDTQSSLSTNLDTGEGLEQYLTPSRADTMLSSFTTLVNESKEKIDTYRQERAVENGTAEPIIEDIEVNADGFGKIVRTTDTPKETKEKPKVQKPDGFIGDIFGFFGAIFGGIYTGVLTILSFALGHPIFMQLFLLFGILLALYKVSQRMSRRPG
jgi:hypothetical protein